MASIIIAQYLDGTESSLLRERLKALGIEAFVKRHGLPRFVSLEVDYRVLVQPADLEKARPIVEEFQSECRKRHEEAKLSLETQCPYCQSREVAIREKQTLWQRIRYSGVTVQQCGECGGQWYT